MNIMFFDKDNPHNMHTVHCGDCHTKGVPKKGKEIIVIVDGACPVFTT